MDSIVFDKDILMEELRATHKIKKIDPSNDIYFDLLNSIVSQQLSGRVADLIFGRFLDLFPERYPLPQHVLSTRIEMFKKCGLSTAKASYVKNVAQFALVGGLQVEKIMQMGDDELLEYLTRIKGVGRWTAEMILIFSLNREDVFPVDDLVIRQSMITLYKLKSEAKTMKMDIINIAENWRPHRTLASLLLWAWKDSNTIK